MEHSAKFEIQILNFSRRGSRSVDNTEDVKEMEQELYRTCTVIVLLI